MLTAQPAFLLTPAFRIRVYTALMVKLPFVRVNASTTIVHRGVSHLHLHQTLPSCTVMRRWSCSTSQPVYPCSPPKSTTTTRCSSSYAKCTAAWPAEMRLATCLILCTGWASAHLVSCCALWARRRPTPGPGAYADGVAAAVDLTRPVRGLRGPTRHCTLNILHLILDT